MNKETTSVETKDKTFNIKFDLKFTLTSFAGYFILFGGMLIGTYVNDKQIIGDSLMYGTLLLGVRKVGNVVKPIKNV